MSHKKDQVLDFYISKYGQPEFVVKAPGRVNIIGEHVDYCEGLVLPFAIEQAMYFCIGSNNQDMINLYSLDFNNFYTIKNDNLNKDEKWHVYFNELYRILKERQINIEGINIVFGSDIPIGGGVSSSSALCCGLILLLNHKFELNFSNNDMINLAAQIEHGIGLKGGKMDQTAILLGKQNKAIFLDCSTTKYSHIDLNLENQFFMLFDTNIQHSLVDSEYNNRRKQVEAALELVKNKFGRSHTFRNTKLKHIGFFKESHPLEYKRIYHVLMEIERVENAVDALKKNDFTLLGLLMNKSHTSLTIDYEVSCNELDFLVDNLQCLGNVLGARMMGGGFGGNVIALMNEDLLKKQLDTLKLNYYKSFGIDLRVMKVNPASGACIL